MVSTQKIRCPGCQVVLKVASELAPGKRIRCPKCAHVFAVGQPQRSLPESRHSLPTNRSSAAVKTKKPAEPSVAGKRRKKTRSANRPLVLGIGLGAAVLLLGTGVALAILRPWETKKAAASTTSPPSFTPAHADANSKKPDQAATTAPEPAPLGNGVSTEPAPSASLENSKAGTDLPGLAEGKRIYESMDCSRCHAIGPGARKGRGPSLARVGADPAHSVDWLSEQIRNPRSHRPGSRMPGYDSSKVNEQDLRKMAEYLASLKG